jgi:N6-L-threonylcarbamoyladenine synthase
MDRTLTLLGIESSCDDTAAAVVRVHPGRHPRSCRRKFWARPTLHEAFGGVVPEIAARAHAERLDGIVERRLKKAGRRLWPIWTVSR